MRTPAPRLHFAIDAASHVIARQQLRRTPRTLVALRIAPAFFFVIGGRAAVVLRNIVEHEALAVFVAQHAAFAADAFRHQNALDAGRPHHPRGMELHEFHVEQRSSRIVGQRLAVGRIFPTIAGHFESAAHAAGRQHHGFRVKTLKRPRSRS